jgi:hypothetical protein
MDSVNQKPALSELDATGRSKSKDTALDIPLVELRELASRHANASHRAGRGTMLTLVVSAFLCSGVGGVLGWQYFGEEAMGLAKALTSPPSLPALSQASTEPNSRTSAGAPTTDAPMGAPESTNGLSQQLENITAELTAVRQRLEQIAAKQEELAAQHTRAANDIVTLQTNEQELRQLMSAQRSIVARLHKQTRPMAPVPPTTESASERQAPPQAQSTPPAPRPTGSAVPRPPAPIAEAWDIAPRPAER